MARRSMAGQLNMFDFFNLDAPASGEVEMVSLMPDYDEEEPEVEKLQPTRQKVSTSVGDDGKVVMSRTYEVAGEKMEIAYLNYNKVRITKGKKEPEIMVFESSKEAVDYYVEKMQELEIDE